MPGKLGRERGQNLKPFLLKTLAHTLAPPDVVVGDVTATAETGSSLATNAIYSSVYGNNFEGIVDKEKAKMNSVDSGRRVWSR